MMRYCKAFGDADPEMIEGAVFRIIVKVPEFGKQAPRNISLRPESGPESIRQRILAVLRVKPLSKLELATALGHKSISGKLN